MRNQVGKGVLGNSIDIVVEQCDPVVEIRADVRVEEFLSKRLWGQILNCKGEPVSNTLIKLAKVECTHGKKQYKGIAHTVTDCEGFYQFDVCAEEDACYKIIVNKAITGPEAIIETGGGNCNACEYTGDGGYKPCHEYKEEVRPYQKCECMKPHPCQQPNPCQHPHPCPQPNPCPQPRPCQCQGHHANQQPHYGMEPRCGGIEENKASRKVHYATYTK